MPLYTWKCSDCGEKTQVVRRVADIDTAPDECSACGKSGEDTRFSRVMCAPRFIPGPGSGAGKGNWLILLLPTIITLTNLTHYLA